MIRYISSTLAALTLGAFASMASALPVAFDTFENFDPATFGGSGIPTDPTAVTTITVGNDTLTLALAATKRFSNPVLGHDGAGTYTATPGINDGLVPGDPKTPGSTWNFSWYIGVEGGGTLADYMLRIYYDLDPAAGTTLAQMGYYEVSTFAGLLPDPTLDEGSENANFGFLSAGAAPFVIPPAPAQIFDANAAGEYSFAITATPIGAATEIARVAINVNVSAVPAPATLGLMGLGLIALGWRRHKG